MPDTQKENTNNCPCLKFIALSSRQLNNRGFPLVFLNVIYSPGHTIDSCVLYSKDDKIAFSGDLIFRNGGYGRFDFPGGDVNKLALSIKNILNTLPNETILFPGHGDETTINHEREFYK